MKKHTATFLLLLLTSSIGHAYVKDKTYKITVLHTNDHHGAFWKNENGEYGMAARANLVKEIREEVQKNGGDVLLLSGGDINTGTPESELADAKPDFLGMSYMGYQAMAVGNHEFDKPFSTLLKQRDEWASFSFLSANIIDKKNKKPFFDPYLRLNLKGLNISILGLTTDQAHEQSIRFPKDKLELISPIKAAKKYIPALKKKSDIIIALTHMGHYPDGEHGSRTPGDVSLAREVNGIDLIVGGHSQKKLDRIDLQNGTSIVQAGQEGRYLGRVDLEFKNGALQVKNYRLIPVNLKTEYGDYLTEKISENRGLKKILAPYKKKALQVTSQKVGQLIGNFEGDRDIIREEQTNLGQFVTFLMADSTKADIAITDSGVIRTSLKEGEISYGDLLRVHPVAFSLKYATVKLTGDELWSYLQKVAVKTSGAYPQLYGLKLKLKEKVLKSVLIRIRGESQFKPIDMNGVYKLAVTDFIAKGGDGYPLLINNKTYKNTDIVDAEVMRKFFLKNGVVHANSFEPLSDILENKL